MQRRKHKAPSRTNYELKNPVISVRVTRELRERLANLQAISGKSLGDILREAVGLQEPSVEESFERGMEVAEDMYKIVYKCSVCGGNEEVFGPIEKEAVAELLTHAGWGHYRCLSRREELT